MNLHTHSLLSVTGSAQFCDTQKRVWVYIGTALLSMTCEEARKLAADLQAAARQGDALVGIQTGNSDLEPAQHATLGAAA